MEHIDMLRLKSIARMKMRATCEFYVLCRDAVRSEEFISKGWYVQQPPPRYCPKGWRTKEGDSILANWVQNSFFISLILYK